MRKGNKIIIILSIALLLVIGLTLVKNQVHKRKLAELEEIIKGQEEKIKQLEEQEKIRQQELEATQTAQAREKVIAKRFLETWEKVIGRDAPYGDIVVSGRVMKIYFSDEYEAVAFISHTPEVIASFALDYFLKETGNKTGTVEYYTPLKRKIFSISESSSGSETKRYDKEEIREDLGE